MIDLTLPTSTTSVWLEVGVQSAFDFALDLPFNPGLFLIGVEPRPERSPRYAPPWCKHKECVLGVETQHKHRALLLERACTSGPLRNVTFYLHASAPCNTMVPIAPHPKADSGMASCFDGAPKPLEVPSLSLQALLHALQPHRVALLKLDVQGHEWPCVESAGHMLHRVDNLFVEIWDAPLQGYVGALNVSGFDEKMAEHSFVRQYCEENKPIIWNAKQSNSGRSIKHAGGGANTSSAVEDSTPTIDGRELNCLYTRIGQPPLLAMGRGRKHGDFGPGVFHNATALVAAHGGYFVSDGGFLTSNAAGALDDELKRLGARFRGPIK